MKTKLTIKDLTESKSLDRLACAKIYGGSARSSLFSQPVHGVAGPGPRVLNQYIDRSINTYQQDNDVIVAGAGAIVTNIGGNHSTVNSSTNTLTANITSSVQNSISAALPGMIQGIVDDSF